MKKKWFITEHRGLYPCVGKIYKIMKISIFLVVLASLQTFATDNYAQTKRMDIKIEASTIVSALEQIENASEFHFFYNNKVIKLDKQVSINLKSKSINEILDELFKDTDIAYTINNKQIILSSKDIDSSSTAQQRRAITGKVTDATGATIPGVSVVVKGTSNGTITDANGKYSLSNILGNETLLFSFVGMKMTEVTVGNKSEYNVTLSEDVISMEDVVVIGYGTQRKMDLTGSISQVKMSSLENKQAVSVADYLRGSIAGLNISRSSSITGSQTFEVRGTTSIGTNTEPLLVVDGMIFGGLLNDINPNDISNIDVLKDASSSAIYGSRAAAGVIIITTKRGTSEKPTINFDAKIGVSSLLRQQEVYNVDGYLNMRGFALLSKETAHRGQPEYYSNPNSLHNLDVSTWLKYDGPSVPSDANPTDFWLQRLKLYQGEAANYKAGKSLDWLGLVFRTGILKDYNVSVSGKTKNLNYYWSLGMLDNKGIIQNDSYQNIRSRVNVTSDITDFLQVGMRANFSATSQNNQPADWTTAFTNSPLGDLYNSDGTYTRYPKHG